MKVKELKERLEKLNDDEELEFELHSDLRIEKLQFEEQDYFTFIFMYNHNIDE